MKSDDSETVHWIVLLPRACLLMVDGCRRPTLEHVKAQHYPTLNTTRDNASTLFEE